MEKVAVGSRTGVVGREAELAVLDAFVADDRPEGALVLAGEPGMGKTTLWEAGVEAARARGLRVFSARPSGAETQLSFAALIDLLDPVGTEELAGLPAPQLRALEVALLRADPSDVPAQPHAIGVAFLNALRAISEDGPVLVAIDDVQWLDPPSASALAFAARRLGREPVCFLLARRPGRSALEDALERREPEHLEVGPLTLGATRRLLADRLALSLPRQLLRRIHATTLGNPLFVLELGRRLAERGHPELGEDMPVPDTVEDVLGTRVARLPSARRRLLLALALSADLRTSQLPAFADAGAVEDAVEAGVLVVDGDRVRASHPLLAAAAKRHALPGERRELHRVLADVVPDQERRALHLALAAERPEAELAATVAEAAAGASARGAAEDSVVLAEHALRLTPTESSRHSDRLLDLAGYLEIAGEMQRLTDLLAPRLDALPPGAPRVRACLLLTGGAAETNDEILRLIERALVESGGDARLRAPALAELSLNASAIRVERLPDAEAWAQEAFVSGSRLGPAEGRFGLYALAWARALRGNGIDDECRRFHALTGTASHLTTWPDRVAGQRFTWRGELSRARATLGRLLSLADERGEPVSYALLRLHLCELALRVGDFGEAGRVLDEWSDSYEGELLLWPMYERCRALMAAGRGLADEAARWGADAIARSEDSGVCWDLLEARRSNGIAALLDHEPARAVEWLAPVWHHTEREGVDDPGAFPVAPELVEALAELERYDEAVAVLDRLRHLVEGQQHPWGLATTKRCTALVGLARHADGDEGAALTEAATDYEALGLRFDRGRSLLGLGRAERRRRKWGSARRSLEEAAAIFDEIDSPGWADKARSELARVAARRPATAGALTAAERRVVELAADGLANKQIAQTLFVSVHTVEVHLSHAYAKLGIRSRRQLARRLAEVD